MFYNHDILTNRKYGIATIWLVATLGSKSTLRKFNRKTIYEVDIVGACTTIIEPDVPMALRLQSNLLFGVTRVYDQQCTFVLKELESLQTNMTQAMRAVTRKDLDLEVGRSVRPEQLLLQDDPAFMPDFNFDNLGLDINLDLPGLDYSRDDSSQSSIVQSPRTPRASMSTAAGFPQIVIPTSDSAGIGGFGLDYEGGSFSWMGRSSTLGRANEHRELLLDNDADFIFDENGMMHDIIPQGSVSRLGSLAQDETPGGVTFTRRPESEASALAHVRREQEEAKRAAADAQDDFHLDDGALMVGDDYDPHADAQPFPLRHQAAMGSPSNILRSSPTTGSQEEGSSETAEAPQRRRPRGPNKLKADIQTEVGNSVIVTWNNDYLANMAKDTAKKALQRAPYIAKKNAEHWMWTMGIGGIGRHLSNTKIPSPLDIFHGDKLMEMVTGAGKSPVPTDRKRSHSAASPESDSEERRRVRLRDDDPEVGRAEGDLPLDDDGFMMIDDAEPEVGRNPPTPLDVMAPGDPSSLMPWNMSASQRASVLPGSAIPFGRSGFAVSRAPSITSATPFPTTFTGRRLTTASPLFGHGVPLRSRQGSLAPQLMGGATSSVAGDFGYAGLGDDDNLGLPSDDGNALLDEQAILAQLRPTINTESQTESQRLRQALDHESDNFLVFVNTAIAEQQEQQAAAKQVATEDITFETLLPSDQSSYVVAAQGLLHCLTLATKGLLSVQQDEDYGDIVLRLPQVVSL